MADLECQGCGNTFNERIVRYYSDEMREERLICPHCQASDFKTMDKESDEKSAYSPQKGG